MNQPTNQPTVVEVLPGLELSLFPWEDVAVVAEELSDFFDEVESQPGLGWPPSEEELEAMYLAKSDPTWVRWLEEGSPVAGFTWEMPDDVPWTGQMGREPGYYESIRPWEY